jgi:hypothetical protein
MSTGMCVCVSMHVCVYKRTCVHMVLCTCNTHNRLDGFQTLMSAYGHSKKDPYYTERKERAIQARNSKDKPLYLALAPVGNIREKDNAPSFHLREASGKDMCVCVCVCVRQCHDVCMCKRVYGNMHMRMCGRMHVLIHTHT